MNNLLSLNYQTFCYYFLVFIKAYLLTIALVYVLPVYLFYFYLFFKKIMGFESSISISEAIFENIFKLIT